MTTDPINETSRVSITGGMAKAMVKYGAARQCPAEGCKFGIPKYTGRYPKNCPRCGGEMVGPSESVEANPMSDIPVVCASRSHRVQSVIESGKQSFKNYLNDKSCSRAITVRYGALPEGFRHWLEGPQQSLYYRVESRQDPLLMFEFDDKRKRVRAFATTNPTRYLGFDREGVVDEDHEGTFEPEVELNEDNVRMVEVGEAGVLHRLSASQAAPLHLFISEEAASHVAERFDLPLKASKRHVGNESLWILVHESGLALGRGEVRRLEEEHGGPAHALERSRLRNRSLNKTHDRVAGSYVEDKRASIHRPRKPGQGRTVVRGGMRINTDKGAPKPRKDVSRSLQNKKNATGPRATRNRIKGLKKFHRTSGGKKMFRELGNHRKLAASHDVALRHKLMDVVQRIQQYSSGQTRRGMSEDVGTLRPRSQGGTEQATSHGPQNIENPTTEDHLDGILRRLIATQDLDVLQDIEFDEDTGSIYFFFDPILDDEEVLEILEAVRQERSDVMLIASPDMSLDGESVESDWWVLFLPGPEEGTEPDPSVYAASPDQYATKVQAVVMAQPSPPEAVAQGIDVSKLLKAAGS